MKMRHVLVSLLIIIFVVAVLSYLLGNKLIADEVNKLSNCVQSKPGENAQWETCLTKLKENIDKNFDSNVITFLISLITVIILASAVVFLSDASKKFGEINKVQKEIMSLASSLKQTASDMEAKTMLMMTVNILIAKTDKAEEIQTYLMNCSPYVERAYSIPSFVVDSFGSLVVKNKIIKGSSLLRELHQGIFAIIEDKRDRERN